MNLISVGIELERQGQILLQAEDLCCSLHNWMHGGGSIDDLAAGEQLEKLRELVESAGHVRSRVICMGDEKWED